MITLYDAIGLLGVGLILYSYWLLQSRRVSVEDLKYSVLNLLGSLLIIVSLIKNFNLPSFVIEVIWVAISLFGLWRAWRDRRPGGRERPDAE